MSSSVDQDIQCLLCDRVIAEVRRGRLVPNPNYERDVTAALRSGRCGYCGGRLVPVQVMPPHGEIDYRVRRRRRAKPA
ncbi:MAG: hypothetical protein IRZ14_16235 [Chloroflexi bacterium]|nr:hypothetical protein [Chloroflexota bacterium]